MPQLEQTEFFISQLFWLVLTFTFLLIFLWRISLPRISSVLEKRESKINSDIQSAKKLHAEAEEIHSKIELQLHKAHNQANELIKKTTYELQNKSSEKLDDTKPVVIIYHPGKDACNSSGSATKETLKNWHKTLEDGVQQLKANAPIYLYKEKEALEKYDGILNWHKDPDGLTEKLFFKYHYPCSSFVVISSDGEYISYFGEFSKEYVWNAINLISK